MPRALSTRAPVSTSAPRAASGDPDGRPLSGDPTPSGRVAPTVSDPRSGVSPGPAEAPPPAMAGARRRDRVPPLAGESVASWIADAGLAARPSGPLCSPPVREVVAVAPGAAAEPVAARRRLASAPPRFAARSAPLSASRLRWSGRSSARFDTESRGAVRSGDEPVRAAWTASSDALRPGDQGSATDAAPAEPGAVWAAGSGPAVSDPSVECAAARRSRRWPVPLPIPASPRLASVSAPGWAGLAARDVSSSCASSVAASTTAASDAARDRPRRERRASVRSGCASSARWPRPAVTPRASPAPSPPAVTEAARVLGLPPAPAPSASGAALASSVSRRDRAAR